MHTRHTEVERILAAAADIALDLAAQAESIHSTARMPEQIVARMREAGLFQILQPARFGGRQLDLTTCFEVQRILSHACMSAGWLSGIFGLQAWQLALFDPRAQRDVWNERPDALISSAFMPSGQIASAGDGFVLSGQWHYSSGSPHSDWILLGGLVVEEGKAPDYRAFLLPRADYAPQSNWRTVGMRATESHSVTVKEAYVPAYRTFRTADGFRCVCAGHALHDDPLYRVPFGQLFALSIALPAVGALEGALAETLAMAADAPTPASVARHDPAQLAVTEALETIHECRASAAATLAQLSLLAAEHTAPALVERARMRFDSARISSKCQAAINALFLTHGSRSVYSSSKLSQAWLDINAANLHAGNHAARFGKQYLDVLRGGDIKDVLL